MRKTRLLRATVLAVACSLSMAVFAQSDATKSIDIPPGDLVTGLQALTRQSGAELAYREDLLAGLKTKGVRGTLTAEQALEKLLEGSGFKAKRDPSGALMILKNDGSAPVPPARMRLTPSKASDARNDETKVTDIEKMTVTGTRIRGGTTPSPVVTIGSENIKEEGFNDLGEVIRSVPQNFTGGQNPGVLMGNVTGGGMVNQNLTGGSGLNLRGLGPDASLTLLNGHRMPYSGFVQAVDISAIPVEAVERVEIVADGASAIYGSDAVGGVANVILKSDYDGATVGTRYGAATEGGLVTHEYNVTAGTTWSGGGFIGTYKQVSTSPIYARQRDYTDQIPEPSTIYPGSDLRSTLVSAHQAIGDYVELRLDAFRTERTQTYSYYFDSPSIYNHLATDTTTTVVSPTLELSLPHDWKLSVDGTWGKDERIRRHTRVNAASSVGTPYLDNCDCNKIGTWEVGTEGPLFELSSGEARLAAGVGYRKNEYVSRDYMAGTVTIRADEGVHYGYAELNVPLIGDGSRSEGLPRLALTAAARRERYDSFGGVTTPKLGLIYNVNADFTAKLSWGRSFKAPTLYQLDNPMLAVAIAPSFFGGTGYTDGDTLLFRNGGNPDLKAERARTWSASLAFHPDSIPGLETELTWFDVNFQDRVVQPITDSSGALANPRYQEFIDYSPSLALVNEVVAMANPFYNYLGHAFDPTRVVAILDARYVNATRQKIRGADLTGAYSIDLDVGRLTIRGSASWLESTQKTAGTPAAYDLAGTLNNPAKFNGRIGAVWRNRGFSTSVFANYTGGVTDVLHNERGASFTTLDAALNYGTGDRAGAWSNVDFSLAVQNLFDRHPPLYTPETPMFVPPYDSTNYSAIGRFVNISLSKHW